MSMPNAAASVLKSDVGEPSMRLATSCRISAGISCIGRPHAGSVGAGYSEEFVGAGFNEGSVGNVLSAMAF